jgi:hypothetical protein
MERAIEASHEGTNENAVASDAIAELIRNGGEAVSGVLKLGSRSCPDPIL